MELHEFMLALYRQLLDEIQLAMSTAWRIQFKACRTTAVYQNKFDRQVCHIFNAPNLSFWRGIG